MSTTARYHKLIEGAVVKKCPKCDALKEANAFSVDRRSPDGLCAYCKECERARLRAYYQDHKDERNRASADYHARNRDQMQAKHHEYWAANADAFLGKHRAYYRENRDSILVQQAAYRQEHITVKRQRDKSYCARPDVKERRSEINAEHKHVRRARENGNGGRFSAAQWRALKTMFANRCLRCGRSEPEIKLTPDHIVPLSKGGRNDIDNIQPLCLTCNMSKGTTTIDYRSGAI
jgi:5-methylcytosine-specific restriction endonuclease McrA